MSAEILTAVELDTVRQAGAILKECLQLLPSHVAPGITTKQLDAIAEEFIRSHKYAVPAFKGFHGFPATLCTSVNHYCVHSMPNNYALQEGDIIALDCGVKIDGLYTDACITVGVGVISKEDQHLLDVTANALQEVVPLIKAGVHTGDLSECIQTHVESNGLHIIRSLTGHGLGHDLHGDPNIPNAGKAGTGDVLLANTVIAIEPIVCIGDSKIATDKDGWSIYMKDGKNSAHFEHTIIVLEDGCEVVA